MSKFRYVRPDRFPPVVKNLIIINVLFYVAQITLDKQYQLTDYLALHPVNSPGFEPYQLFTHMFSHSTFDPFTGRLNIFHILFNMFGLWMFGRILETVWGPRRFLIFYLVCGIGAAAAYLIQQYITGGMAPAVGASGAVMGIFVAFGYLFPNTELMLLFPPIPIKAKWMVIILVAFDLFGGFSRTPGDNIAHFAHLGGALTGFILVFIWNKTNRKTLY